MKMRTPTQAAVDQAGLCSHASDQIPRQNSASPQHPACPSSVEMADFGIDYWWAVGTYQTRRESSPTSTNDRAASRSPRGAASTMEDTYWKQTFYHQNEADGIIVNSSANSIRGRMAEGGGEAIAYFVISLYVVFLVFGLLGLASQLQTVRDIRGAMHEMYDGTILDDGDEWEGWEGAGQSSELSGMDTEGRRRYIMEHLLTKQLAVVASRPESSAESCPMLIPSESPARTSSNEFRNRKRSIASAESGNSRAFPTADGDHGVITSLCHTSAAPETFPASSDIEEQGCFADVCSSDPCSCDQCRLPSAVDSEEPHHEREDAIDGISSFSATSASSPLSSSPPPSSSCASSSCIICMDGYLPGQEVGYSVNPQCVHVFHKECIVEWFMRSTDTCPCCRSSFLVGECSDAVSEARAEDGVAAGNGDGQASERESSEEIGDSSGSLAVASMEGEMYFGGGY